MSDDFIIDDLSGDSPKKKKSGRKGKAGERDLVHIFNKRFVQLFAKNPSGGMFSRSIGSGNRHGQKVVLSESANQIFSGDLCTPPNFKFVIESKKGYNETDICCLFGGKCKKLDEFLEQTVDETKRSGKPSLLIWKKDYKPALCFIKKELLPKNNFSCVMFYREWAAVSFEELLTMEDSFWFVLPV